ncbi:hypothetical protein [Acaryochloris sp. IP29b_bin.137]|uniref:roadblock/LC7 domain-containing protein n=1 Tax=Acaryochloris sp. IP29b_bin.137 TaxID=2969217 RepID=UPI002621822A|nr:hypothetical protein [Acaryochloris sp. IP29b_bin.137]
MNKVAIETLLADFVSTSSEIQGAVMVSPQGQPLTHPIGISETSTHIMAGSMLHLAGCVSEQCHWRAVDWVTVQALEGYLILTQCIQDIFLLIRSQDVPSGYLLRYIQHYLDKLRTSLRVPNYDATVVQMSHRPTELINRVASANGTHPQATSNGLLMKRAPLSEPFGTHMGRNGTNSKRSTPVSPVSSLPPIPLHLDEFEIAYCQKELAEIIGPIASLICNRILAQNPHLRLMDFVKALSQQIPDPQKALDFQRRVLSE